MLKYSQLRVKIPKQKTFGHCKLKKFINKTPNKERISDISDDTKV